MVILSTSYFPPIKYYKKIINHKEVYIEIHENFIKQTYRNRCEIAGPNGMQSLVIPIEKKSGTKVKIKDTKVSYDENWQKDHLKTFLSAYNKSPFFEYIIDDFNFVFNKKFTFLLDLNYKCHEVICDYLRISSSINYTNEYQKEGFYSNDYRYTFQPKNRKKVNAEKNYNQVFIDKHGFIPGLSVIDLLFNEGNNAYEILNSEL